MSLEVLYSIRGGGNESMLSETVTQGRPFFPKVEKVCGRFLMEGGST